MFARRVDQVHQRAAALDMAEEAVAEPVAFVRALDQAGNVGEHEVAVVDLHHAEAGMQRGEGIVGDLRPRRRDGGEQRRLARVRQPDEADVGDQFQAQNDRALDARAGRGWRGAARDWSRW